jgi:hypothetical protein
MTEQTDKTKNISSSNKSKIKRDKLSSALKKNLQRRKEVAKKNLEQS